MFCDQCGREAVADAHFCSNCGRPLQGGTVYQAAGAPHAPVYMLSPSRVNSHIRTLGILWIIIGLLRVLSVGWVWFVGRMIFPSVLSSIVPTFTLGSPLSRLVEGGLAFASVLIILQAALAFFAAWGLLDRQSWGRVVGIIAAVFSLWHIPFGTALGIYTLWVLLPASSETEYHNLARA